MDFCSDGTCKCRLPAKFEVRSFTRSWDTSDWNFGGRANPQSWGRAGRRGSALVPFDRALVSSYKLSIVTFPLSLRLSEILLLLCSSTPLFPTPPLVSQKFPYVSLGVGLGGWPLGFEERRCWANCQCNSFLRFPIYMWFWSTNVIDRQTDNMQFQKQHIGLEKAFSERWWKTKQQESISVTWHRSSSSS